MEAAPWMPGHKAPGQERTIHGSQNAETSQKKLHGRGAVMRSQNQECAQERDRAQSQGAAERGAEKPPPVQ